MTCVDHGVLACKPHAPGGFLIGKPGCQVKCLDPSGGIRVLYLLSIKRQQFAFAQHPAKGMPLRGTAGEKEVWKRETAKAQNDLQKTRTVPAVWCITIPVFFGTLCWAD